MRNYFSENRFVFNKIFAWFMLCAWILIDRFIERGNEQVQKFWRASTGHLRGDNTNFLEYSCLINFTEKSKKPIGKRQPYKRIVEGLVFIA